MRRLGVAVAVLLALAVAADFGARVLVQRLAARALEDRRGVDGDVSISFGGFPFLLHLKDRRFTSVTVEAEDIRSGSVASGSAPAEVDAQLASARLEMSDVRISGDLWGDDPDRVIAARSGRGRAALDEAELNALVPDQYAASLTLLDGTVRLTAASPVGEQTVEVPANAVRVESDGTLVVEAPAPVGAVLIPLPSLVPGVTFRDVDVARGRIEVRFGIRDVRVSL